MSGSPLSGAHCLSCPSQPETSRGGLIVITDRLTIGKAKIINRAIQDIGMGRYQWELYVLCGFGWIADK